MMDNQWLEERRGVWRTGLVSSIISKQQQMTSRTEGTTEREQSETKNDFSI